MKNKLHILAIGFALTTQMVMAQVPSYVPTNGLVGYWPFNGNANDESGNGNNGTVNGATLTTDRFGISNSAYIFDGLNDFISISNSTSLQFPASMSFTVSFYYNAGQIVTNSSGFNGIISKAWPTNSTISLPRGWQIGRKSNNYAFESRGGISENENDNPSCGNDILGAINQNNWEHCVTVFDRTNGLIKFYKNGNFIGSTICSNINSELSNLYPLLFGVEREGFQYVSGKMDDIGVWNRALTQQEITNLYNSTSTSECLTMTINTGPLTTNPVTYTSSVNIYPNPANDQITIDCGNLANVVGWNIKITNMLGQEVFNQPMDTQQYVVPLNSWTGQGMYFVKIINAQNEVVNIKKIILQ